MKKIKAAILIFVIIVLMAGCGESKQTSTNSVKEVQKNSFPIVASEYVANLDTIIVKSGYDFPKISECDMKTDKGTIEGIGDYIANTYSLSSGVDLIIYYDPDSKRIIQIFYVLDKEKLTEEGNNFYSFCIGVNIGMFEPNKGDEIDSKLNLMGPMTDTNSFASGEYADFSYIIDGKDVMLLISPTKK